MLCLMRHCDPSIFMEGEAISFIDVRLLAPPLKLRRHAVSREKLHRNDVRNGHSIIPDFNLQIH